MAKITNKDKDEAKKQADKEAEKERQKRLNEEAHKRRTLNMWGGK